jgi:NADP-reducing hydrogenase subunit HndB
MPKLRPEDLTVIAEKAKKTLVLRDGDARARVVVHMGTCGIAAGARKIMSAFSKEIETRNLDDVLITTSSCAGLCSREPMATVELRNEAPVRYADLVEEAVPRIVEEHIQGGKIVTEFALAIGGETVA